VSTEAEDIVGIRLFILFRKWRTLVLKSTIVCIFGANTGTDPFETYIASARNGAQIVTSEGSMVGALPLHDMEATCVRREQMSLQSG
jgi:hypothetical protein